MHEGDEGQVRRWLSDVAAPSTRLTASGLARLGRARARRRRVATVAGLAAAVVLVAAIPAAGQLWHRYAAPVSPADQGDCVATELAAPPEFRDAATESGAVTAVGPGGRYLVGSWGLRWVRWDHGVPSVLDAPEEFGLPVAVNARGDVVGRNGWVYRDGEARPLPGAEPVTSAARARLVGGVNAAGEVVGMLAEPSRYVVWPADGGDPRELPMPDGREPGRFTLPAPGTVMVITDNGTVVAHLPQQLGGGIYAWLPDGGGRQLQLPEGATGARLHGAAGTWAVVGASAGTESTVLRWNLQTGEVSEVAVLPGTRSGWHAEVAAVSGAGNIVIDWRQEEAGSPEPEPLLMLADGEQQVLPVPEGTRTGWLGMSMSDDARAVAGTVEVVGSDGALTRPVMWSCG